MKFFGNGRAPKCDGNSADWHKPHIEKTTIKGVPQNTVATARCGTCGTSSPITGRPGQTVNSFTCRTCSTTCNNINDGRGFTFQSFN